MKIGVNSRDEIKQIDIITDDTLTVLEVDREEVFGNMSDFMILNHIFKYTDYGYYIQPCKYYPSLLFEDYVNKVNEQEDKISILESEQEAQNKEILSNMLATTEVFEMILTMSASMSVDIENKNKNLGGRSMVEVYVTLILKGVKTIDQVPAIIREKVKEQLDLLVK